MHAYYLGCPMSEEVMDEHHRLLTKINENEQCDELGKEAVIILDADFFDDYIPTEPVSFTLPVGYQAITPRGLSSSAMIVSFSRAKITLDLALPGPERLSSEAVLFGAVPIISHRWNGGDHVDFPGLLRVDALNGTNITMTLQYVYEHYPDFIPGSPSLLSYYVRDHYRYVTSMQHRLSHTADLFFASKHLTFVLTPTMALQDEKRICLQILALIYLFPLASFDIVVGDPLWFMRENYLFLDYMRQAGYWRYDPFNPDELDLYFQYKHLSLLRIWGKHEVEAKDDNDSTIHVQPRPWENESIWVNLRNSQLIFKHSLDLFRLMSKLQRPDEQFFFGFANGNNRMLLSVAGGNNSLRDVLSQNFDSCPVIEIEDTDDAYFIEDLIIDCNRHGATARGSMSQIVVGVCETPVWQLLIKSLFVV